jgi:hypothetical protein
MKCFLAPQQNQERRQIYQILGELFIADGTSLFRKSVPAPPRRQPNLASSQQHRFRTPGEAPALPVPWAQRENPALKSEFQFRAARANGAKSKGAGTVKGKTNSSRNNNTRHGLLAHCVVLEEESEARFPVFTRSAGEGYELMLTAVENMAAAIWCLLRVQTLHQISAYQTQVRYEIAFERQYTRALARLESFKAATPSGPEN